ncbi:TIGR03809 family protein [Bradyrhizobium japonicum]|uniref:TIGR03809 family protein n=1 Tax=Bradyrhizobium japonicum TaxID=375 RepID=UPI001BA48EFF|nr:TIGR03809 family protein [Bradyrhizobium japonicum]MBR0992296.1 TIGR03809 family protein [Bradyrhizobium japonicum]
MLAGRDVAARWCALAEQRLQHLSEMFETGRWRRYHSEIAFLENIQEAKRAVQTWRALATGADVAEAAASVTPAFGWTPATMPRVFPREQQAQIVESRTLQPETLQAKTLQPKAVHIAPETAVPVRLDAQPDVLAEITEAPFPPPAASAAMASFVAPAEMPPLKAPAARAPFIAPAVRSPLAAPAATASVTAPEVRPPLAVAAAKPPKTAPAAMAALLPQFAPPAEEIVAAPERVVEFTFSLDGLEAKYPLLRNAF